MRFGLKDMDWEYVGSLFAHKDAKNQAKFFKAFLKECKTWGTHWQIEMQLAYINKLLTPEEREDLSMISYNKEERNENKI